MSLLLAALWFHQPALIVRRCGPRQALRLAPFAGGRTRRVECAPTPWAVGKQAGAALLFEQVAQPDPQALGRGTTFLAETKVVTLHA
jgi:hypothetical protein